MLGSREKAEQGECDRIEGGNLVVGSGVEAAGAAAGSAGCGGGLGGIVEVVGEIAGEGLGEVAAALEQRGHGGEIVFALDLAVELEREIEERLVVTVVEVRNPDGAGEIATELVAAEFRFGGEAGAGVEVVDGRVEEVVADVVERGSVEAVGAVLDGEVDDAAGEAAILGAVVGGLHAELLNGVERRRDLRAGVAGIFVVDAVDVDAGGVGARPAGDVGCALGFDLGGLDAGDGEGEVVEVAAVEGNLGDFDGRDDIALGHVFGVDETDVVGGDGDGGGDVANLELNVEAGGLVGLQLEVLLGGGLEAGHGDGHVIQTGIERGDGVLALAGGGDGPDLVSAGVADGHGGAGDDGARDVGDAADESGGRRLRVHRAGDDKHDGPEQEPEPVVAD